MPWCMRVLTKLMMVLSLPPPVPVLANTLPALPTNAPFAQRPPVWSRKLRIWAAMLPKRVGVPKRIASYSPISFGSATGAAWSSFTPAFAAASGDIVSGTRLTVTSVPSTERAPSAMALASVSTWP